MKKTIAMILALCISSCSICIPACAVDIVVDNQPSEIIVYYVYTVSATSDLSIYSGKASCTSELSGGSSVTKIVGNQYLEKKGLLGTWSTVSSGSWSKTLSSSYMLMNNSKSSLDSGTYRLRTVFTVYSGTSYEIVEKISSEVKI